MKITRAELEAIAVSPEGYPPADVAEIAFAGRSNVGKSSLLNLLTGRKALARVSGSPGKTRTINFYRINDSFRIVDLPGYGYAQVSRSETAGWAGMMEEYLAGRENLIRVVQMVDIRHKPAEKDIQMYEYLRYYGLDGTVVAAKADKISKNQAARSLSVIRKTLGLGREDRVFACSALKKTGYTEILDELERLLNEVL